MLPTLAVVKPPQDSPHCTSPPFSLQLHRCAQDDVLLRIATRSPDRWSRKAAEWNLGLIISTRSQRKAGRPAERWEDDLNEFVTDEETQTTQGDDLKNNNTRLSAAKKIYEREMKEKRYTKHAIDD